MIELKEVNFGELKKGIMELNQSGALEKCGLKAQRVVGVKKSSMVDDFVSNIDVVAEKELGDDLPKKTIVEYNKLFADELDEEQKEELREEETYKEEDSGELTKDVEEVPDPEEKEETEETEKKEEKEETEKKEEKNAKEPGTKEKNAKDLVKTKPRSCYGHIASAKSGRLDEILCKGAAYDAIEIEVGVKRTRIKGHIKVLKDKGLTILVKENKEEPGLTHVRVKEDSL